MRQRRTRRRNRSEKWKGHRDRCQQPADRPDGYAGLPTNIPAGVGASGTIHFSSDIENAIYKLMKK
jgi:hypothetical protein